MRWSEIVTQPLLEAQNLSVDDPKFKAWFGNSHVVDSSGKPLLVYHGTNNGGFDKFIGARATYFSDSYEFASRWGGQIYACYLRIINPYVLNADREGRHFDWDREDIREFKAAGQDGVIIVDESNDGSIFTVFSNKQIMIANQNAKPSGLGESFKMRNFV